MKYVFWRAGVSVAVLLGGVMLSGGCTDEETGFFIQGNLVLEPPECIARPNASSTLLATGLLDVAIRPDYQAALLVGSQLAPRGDKTNLRTETMITNITGAEVKLYRDTGALDTEFTVPATGVIPPNSGTDPGFGVVFATVVPPATGAQIGQDELTAPGQQVTRVAEITVFGKTIGGLELESAPFTYVIHICEGCIVDFPSDALNPETLECEPTSDDSPGTGCHIGQDDVVDCRSCYTSNPYCLYPGGSPP